MKMAVSTMTKTMRMDTGRMKMAMGIWKMEEG